MGLFKKSRGLVGLDIGSSAIKAVELKPTKGGGYQVVAMGIEPLTPEAIVDGTILDAQVVVDAIRKLFRDNKIKTKDVATSVSGNAVIIKKIQLPNMPEAELAESIQWEAEQYIPFDIDDVNIDYQILAQGGENMDVLLVAVKKDKINDYSSVISQAGLNPVLVDIDSFAVQSAYEANYELPTSEVVALVNVGASIMNINILRNGTSIFWRDISSGGNKFTEEIQKELHLSQEQADALKRGESVDGASPQSAASVLEGVAKEIADEIDKTFKFFSATTNTERIHRIVIAGGSSRIPAIESVLSERTGAKVEILNPFEQLQLGKGIDADQAAELANQMSVAVGLGTRSVGDTRINLLREKRGAGAKKAVAGPTEGLQPIHFAFVGILLCALGWVGYQYYSLSTSIKEKQTEKSSLEEEKKKLEAVLQEKEELEKKKQLLDRKIGIIKELKSKQLGPVKLLDELSRNLPDYVWFQSVGEENQTIRIEGYALNANKVADFVENLVRSEHFTVEDGPHYNQATGQVSFRVTVQFKLAQPPAGGATPTSTQ